MSEQAYKELFFKYIVYYIWIKYNTHNVWNIIKE